jgi:enamine deaminase RidA (YjgF/YER057c/UK114 family)
MALNRINPDTLARPHGFAQVVSSTGSKLVLTSGQVGVDGEHRLVGGDYRSQARQAAANIYLAVAAAGAGPGDIARLTLYVVDPTQANLDEVYAGLGDAAAEVGAKAAAMSLIGVTALSDPTWLVEIDAIAVLD